MGVSPSFLLWWLERGRRESQGLQRRALRWHLEANSGGRR